MFVDDDDDDDDDDNYDYDGNRYNDADTGRGSLVKAQKKTPLVLALCFTSFFIVYAFADDFAAAAACKSRAYPSGSMGCGTILTSDIMPPGSPWYA